MPSGPVTKEIGGSIAQKSLMLAVEKSSKYYFEATGKKLTKEQTEFLIDVVTNLSDIAITRLREGKIKPRDLAQTAVSQALSASGLSRDGSNTAVYTDIGLSLVSLALSSVEMYGLVVTSNTVAAAAAPETLGASLVGDAGVVTVAVLFWNYQVLQTTMRCAEDFKKLEDAVPDRHNIESKRQNFTNVGNVTR